MPQKSVQEHLQSAQVIGTIQGNQFVGEGSPMALSEFLSATEAVLGAIICGDVHQLGSHLVADKIFNIDLHQGILDRLFSQILWLQRCFRMPCPMTEFLDATIYHESRLLSPPLQRIITYSPMLQESSSVMSAFSTFPAPGPEQHRPEHRWPTI